MTRLRALQNTAWMGRWDYRVQGWHAMPHQVGIRAQQRLRTTIRRIQMHSHDGRANGETDFDQIGANLATLRVKQIF